MNKGENTPHAARATAVRIVIYVEGGIVQSVLSDTPGIKAMIVDYDSEKAGDDRAGRSFELVEVNKPYIETTIQGTEE